MFFHPPLELSATAALSYVVWTTANGTIMLNLLKGVSCTAIRDLSAPRRV